MICNFLANLLFQVAEKVVVKKFNNGYFQSIAYFFNGGNGGALVPSADDII